MTATIKAHIVGGHHNGKVVSVLPKQYRIEIDGYSYARLPQWMMHIETPVYSPPGMSIGDVMKLLLENNEL